MSEVNVKRKKKKEIKKSKWVIPFSLLLYHNASAATHTHVQHIHLEENVFFLLNFNYIFLHLLFDVV